MADKTAYRYKEDEHGNWQRVVRRLEDTKDEARAAYLTARTNYLLGMPGAVDPVHPLDPPKKTAPQTQKRGHGASHRAKFMPPR